MRDSRRMKRQHLRVGKWTKRHGHHLLFALSLLCLILLLAWWTVFISLSVRKERQYSLAELAFLSQKWAYSLGIDSQTEPACGVFPKDKRFEIVPETASMKEATLLAPFWKDLVIQPRAEHLAAIEQKYQRRRLMVIGEGALLVCLLLVSSFVLYRLIYTELRSSRELQEFWCRVTHEIKTPITGLKAFLDTLESQNLSREELADLVKLAQRQVERQQHLAQNILSGQRLGDARNRIYPVAFSLTDFFEKWTLSSGLVRPPNKISIQFPEPEKKVRVFADPDALRVIVDNLVDNATKYCPPPVQLDILVEETRTKVKILFADNGPGFDPKMAKNLFEAFRRLTPELPNGVHGTGMGLYISRQLAHAMSGDLEAQSKGLNRGATFVLTLVKVRDEE